MRKIISVKFKPTGKGYYFDPLNFNIKKGDHVIVETTRGVEYGIVSVGIKEIEESEIHSALKGVIRIATEEDEKKYKENKAKEKEAFVICQEKIRAHGMEMKLVDVE